ncbi:MAG: energy transducer TonB [Terracidiphilus sp.]
MTARVAVAPAAERIPAPVPRVPTAPRAAPPAAHARVVPAYTPPQPRDLSAEGQNYQVESQGKSKKGMLVAILASIVLLAGIGSVGYWKLQQPKTITQTVPVASAATTTSLTLPKPTAATPTSGAYTPPVTSSATADNSTTERPLRAQSDMMNHQLSAPSRIPNDLRMLAGKEPPPSSSGMDGLGGSSGVGNVFNGNGPKVKVEAAKKVSISEGIAGGLLLQKPPPVYPPLARQTHVSGIVVIQATISKTGVVENAHVVSGPTMLRQAAMDAVKTWRYRPYLLDGEPVEVETTVSVNFSLGG